ncbi:MAG TPA: energy transducer TonB [Pyrinomonadaceae bacterium]
MRKPRFRIFVWPLICLLAASLAAAQTGARQTRVAVLDLGGTQTGLRATAQLSGALASDKSLLVMDREESSAAARGIGYNGSLNMTLAEARDLGAAIGCALFITGDAQTLRRSPSGGPVFYEAYASIFIVSARTGRLLGWERPSFQAPSPEEAERALLAELPLRAKRYAALMRAFEEAEGRERAAARESPAPLVEDAPEDEAAAARVGLRLPQPYRRLRPAYPETARSAEAEATVDVQVELDEAGEVRRAEVVRWGGFGLDEEAVRTVRQLHFRPALRGGTPVPVRVLLRYNFRRPQKQ